MPHPLVALADHLTSQPLPHLADCAGDPCTCGLSRAAEMLRVLTSSPAKLNLVDALVLCEEGTQAYQRLREVRHEAVVAWLRGGKVGPKPEDEETWEMREDVRAAHRTMHEAAKPLERCLRAWLG
jgi:hypothetical protein